MDETIVAVKCISCASENTRFEGIVSQRPGRFQSGDSTLVQCPVCGIRFRHPVADLAALEELYTNTAHTTWPDDDFRRDHYLALNLIRYMPQPLGVLDFGCYSGAFLCKLPSGCRRYGIELSESASAVARQRGVEILGKTIKAIDAKYDNFDCITMFDVIEHLTTPVETLTSLSKLLRPGGTLIISTGDSDSLLWRLHPMSYYYYYNEHLTFYNARWFRWFAQRAGLRIAVQRRFVRDKVTFGGTLRQFALLALYDFTQMLYRCRVSRFVAGVFPFSKTLRWTVAPQLSAFPDHLFVALQKEESNENRHCDD